MTRLPEELRDKLICLSCASHTGMQLEFAAKFKCERCGSVMDSEQVYRVHRQARDVVRFGYQYRRVYEHDLARGTLGQRQYLLYEPPAWLVWCGLAALSGIVGNVAYDAVKAMIGRILAKRNIEDAAEHVVIDLNTEEDVDRFITYLRQFKERASDASPEIQRLCHHEQMTDPLLMRGLFSKEFTELSEDEIANVLREALTSMTTSMSLRAHDWRGLFSSEQICSNDSEGDCRGSSTYSST